MMKYFDASSMPNQMIAIGIIATGEIGRINSIIGSRKSPAMLKLPITSPHEMPTTHPMAKPIRMRMRLTRTISHSSPSSSVCQPAAATRAGGGSSCGLKRYVEQNCQNRSPVRIDAVKIDTARTRCQSGCQDMPLAMPAVCCMSAMVRLPAEHAFDVRDERREVAVGERP